MLTSAPGGTDSTRTGVPGALNPGMLKFGLKLGMLKLGMLGIPVHADRAAPQTIKAIARLCIRSSTGPRAAVTDCARCPENTNAGLTAQPAPWTGSAWGAFREGPAAPLAGGRKSRAAGLRQFVDHRRQSIEARDDGIGAERG